MSEAKNVPFDAITIFAEAFCNPAGSTCLDASFITQVPARSLDSTLLQPSIPNSKIAIGSIFTWISVRGRCYSKIVVSNGAKPKPSGAIQQQLTVKLRHIEGAKTDPPPEHPS